MRAEQARRGARRPPCPASSKSVRARFPPGPIPILSVGGGLRRHPCMADAVEARMQISGHAYAARGRFVSVPGVTPVTLWHDGLVSGALVPHCKPDPPLSELSTQYGIPTHSIPSAPLFSRSALPSKAVPAQLRSCKPIAK